jgi:hypothetical protein
MKMLNILSKRQQDNSGPLFAATNVNEARRVRAWLSERFERAKKVGMFSEIVTLTPAMAEVILADCNHGNRPLIWAEAIKDGRWRLTSQGISFSRDGGLNNGQHRLTGTIAAATPIPMLVVFGEDREAFDILDTGSVRGGSDTLHVAGYKNTATLSAAARLLRIILSDAPGSNASFSNDIIRQTVEEHHPLLEDATTHGHNVGKKLRTSAGAVTAALYLIRRHSAHSNRLDVFVGRLLAGTDLRARDPILVLREGLIRSEFSETNGFGSAVRICAAVILAWNKWVNGRTASLTMLRWSPVNPFPKPE